MAEKWPAALKEVWTAKVGIGYSSPIAQEGKIYLFTLQGSKDTLTCFNAADGKVVWSAAYEGGFAQNGKYPGTRATPAIDGKFIYTYGGNGDLVCRAIEDGKEVWHINVLKDTGGQNQTWGIAPSPLIAGKNVYVQGGVGGAAAVAVDKSSGQYVWKSEAKDGGYAHPILIDVQGVRQLICLAHQKVYAMNPDTGATIWSEPWVTKFDVNSTTPIYKDGHLFISSNYDHGCMMLEVSAAGAKKLWENKTVMDRFSAPVLDGDLLFANSEGTIKCLSWPDGKVKWEGKDRIGFGGSFVRAGDKLLTMSDRGKLALLKATADGEEKISEFQLFDNREVWATPLLYDGKIFAKGTEELVCVEGK